MPRKSSDISLLLFILILFSASIGFLHGFKTTAGDAQVIIEDKNQPLGLQDALDLIEPLLFSENMDLAALTLVNYNLTVAKNVLEAILENKSVVLPDPLKINLLISAIAHSPSDEKRLPFFDFLQDYFPDEPIFYYVSEKTTGFFPAALHWAKRNENNGQLVKQWQKRSMDIAVGESDPAFLAFLYGNGLRTSTNHASQLLDQVTLEQKNVSFVPFLIRQLSAEANFSSDGKKTVLMKAVANNNLPMVRALLEEGASPTKVLDSTVGNAIQIAFEKGFVKIEELLRRYQS